MADITCGHCHRTHHSVAVVRACYAGHITRCEWLIETHRGGELFITACDADAHHNNRGWRCENGHEHVNLATQYREGWSYVESYEEAEVLARYGIEARTMTGRLVLGRESFEPANNVRLLR